METLISNWATILAWALGAFFLAAVAYYFYLTLTIRYLDKEIRRLVSDRIVLLNVQFMDGLYLCYNSVTNEFVCQGSDIDEIQDNFRLRYPNKQPALFDGDPAVIKLLVQQVEARNTPDVAQ